MKVTPLFSEILIPIETLSLEVPYETGGKTYVKKLELSFYGLNNINQMDVLEVVEEMEPLED